MYNIGALAGKFLPPHRGHLGFIINAATMCEKLYVVVSDNIENTTKICKEMGVPVMDLKMRAMWLSQELQGFDHIKVLLLDETGIPDYPDGWAPWSNLLKKLIPEPIDVLFGNEEEYREYNNIYFPGVAYVTLDANRNRYPISATEIRKNYMKHWEYILGASRGHFAKKILIAGSESCGKTTTTKYLAKIYVTSWSEEEGRYYSTRHLGGNEEVFKIEDFGMIAYEQYIQDMKALHSANKIVFYDSDAVVTQLYANLYLGENSEVVETFIKPDRYDYVFLFQPTVKWVPDGFRFNSDDETRWKIHKQLKQMYIDKGFGNKIIEIPGNYSERLIKCIELVDSILDNTYVHRCTE